MINLKRKRNLDPIAKDWLKWVREYLFTPRSGNARPRLINNGRTYLFNSYADKLDASLLVLAKDYAKGNTTVFLWVKSLIGWFWSHLDDVILATPAQMRAWINAWARHRLRYPKNLISKLKEVLVPYYEAISREYGYQLIDRLNVRTCPYCNRQYVISYEALSKERPELDHFFPKAKYPMFCLSFYNLIPACHSCNHVKLERMISVNPYENGFNTSFVITDKRGRKLSKSKIFHLTEKEICLDFKNPTHDEKQNIEVLGLDAVYNKHKDYVKELIDKTMAYDKFAREALIDAFQGAGYHPRQVYDFVWGRHLLDAEHEDRPLSKLTKDILDELEVRR